MSAARKLKIYDATVQDVSIDALQIRDDVLQSRAETDPEIVAVYAEKRRGTPAAPGSPFPPVLVFLIDGVLWLADGFHRVKAAQKLGMASIPAIVREGTITDALIAGGEINMSKENLRGYQEDDRKRYAELFIKNGAGNPGKGSWDWSDTEIARRCGLAKLTIRRLRYRLSDTDGLPIPEKVQSFSNGVPNGGLHPYRTSKVTKTPTVSKRADGVFSTYINRRQYLLGKDESQAIDKAKALFSEPDNPEDRLALNKTGDLVLWLRARGIRAEGAPKNCMVRHVSLNGATLLLMPEVSTEKVLANVALGHLLKKAGIAKSRVIVVGYLPILDVRSILNWVVEMASAKPNAVEFMTPEEVVEAFGGKDDAS